MRKFGLFLEDSQCLQRSRNRSGRNRRAEHIRAGCVPCIINRMGGRCHKSADGSERFGKCPHDDIHFIRQSEIVCSAPSPVTEYAETMRVIDHDSRPVFSGEADDLGQIADIAAHGEHAVCHDQRTGMIRHFLQAFLQMLHIAVTVPEHRRVRKLAAVVYARMVFLIHDDVVVFSADSGNNAKVGKKARRERHNGFFPEK